MLKQDVPLRTGWFGYRKLDVENCIAHIRAAYAAELRLARQTQQDFAVLNYDDEWIRAMAARISSRIFFFQETDYSI